MRDFIRWLFETQLVSYKAEVWQAFFKNFITVVLVLAYVYMLVFGVVIPQGFEIIIGFVLGFYFKERSINKKV